MIGLLLFLGTFALLALQASAGPPWLDGSEFIATAHLLAVPHPTGEPLYLVLAKLADLIPLGAPALRLAWLSALFGALAVERLYRVARALTSDVNTPWPAAAVAALFAVTRALFLIGHRAEVYALQLFLALAVIDLALRFRATADPRFARLGALALGAGLATHPLLTVLLVPGILLIAGRPLFRPRLLLPTLGFAALPLVAYGVLALRGRAGGLVGWGDTTHLGGFLDVVLGRAFAKGFTAPVTGSPIASLAVFAADHLGEGGLLLVLAAAIVGLVRLIRGSRAIGVGLALIMVLGFASRGLWPFEADTPDTAGYFALPLALLLALSAIPVSRLFTSPRLSAPWPHLLTAALALAAALLFPRPSSADREGGAGRELVLRALDDLPAGALLLLDDYNLLFMTWYLQAVERVRPDVAVVYQGSLARPWYRHRLGESDPALVRRLGRWTSDPLLFTDDGVGAAAWPATLRERLVPAGLFLRLGGEPRPLRPQDWMAGRQDLDRQTRRALGWLHFRRACFHAARRDPAAAWHAAELDRLSPGTSLAGRLAAGDLSACR